MIKINKKVLEFHLWNIFTCLVMTFVMKMIILPNIFNINIPIFGLWFISIWIIKIFLRFFIQIKMEYYPGRLKKSIVKYLCKIGLHPFKEFRSLSYQGNTKSERYSCRICEKKIIKKLIEII